MSVGSINGYTNWWQWREQAAPTSTDSTSATTTAANTTSGAIGNSGSVTAGASSFLQALSADLQAMLTQAGSTATTAPAATGDQASASQASVSQAVGGGHHHHHHHAASGGSTQQAADQVVGQALQNGTLSADQINQSASVFAADIVQALQSYGGAGAASGGISAVA